MSQSTPIVPAPGAEPARVTPAALCRVTIAADGRQVDVSVPADVPIALVLPDLVGLTSAGNPATTSDLRLARLGRPALRGDHSFAQQGITDGDLLMLTDPARPVSPIFDDVATALSGRDLDRARSWGDGPRLALTWFCSTALLVGSCIVLFWGGSPEDATLRVIAALGTAAILLLCCVIAARTYQAAEVSAALGAAAAPLAFTGAVILIPVPQAGGVLFGCALAGATAALAVRIAGRGESVLTAVAFLAVLAMPAALLGTLTSQAVPALAATLTVTGLIGLTLAGRLALNLSRLPVPALPGPLAHGMEPDPAPEMPSFASLQRAADRADATLTGLVCAAATAIALGAGLCAFGSGSISWVGVGLGGVSALVLALRARTFAAAAPAVALLIAAAGLVLAVSVGISLVTEYALLAFSIAILAAATALIAGTVLPGRRFSPPTRRSLEIFELIVIAVAVPLACWVAGLFDSLSIR